eukprot:TRINITY_DN3149_c0_g1_i2.p1 TRINITY_DN3149_c0_g1~~TRINITY_DN3149_c0_g1_i2.p1  ORF type:complete len:313 (-),score=46.62 TRINITY_DN3149_c0_g1_i2:129-1067(-)
MDGATEFFELMEECAPDPFSGPYPLPFEREIDWSKVLTHDVAQQLVADGWAVVDGALGEGYASALRAELEWLQRKGLMSPNKTQFTTADGPKQFSKPHILELDLHHEQVRQRVPEFDALWCSEALSRRLGALVPSFELAHGTSGHTVKLQYNSGSGGCFPFHYDNPGPPNNRAVTCLLYLNPGWKQGDGGELVLQPFLKNRHILPPLMDRMVLFRSDVCLHRVLPATTERYCCTIWIDGMNTNQDQDTLLKDHHLKLETDQAIELFRKSGLQRVFSRAVYSQEYEESLWECMQGVGGAVSYTHLTLPTKRIV